jgi:hypothetical protein
MSPNVLDRCAVSDNPADRCPIKADRVHRYIDVVWVWTRSQPSAHHLAAFNCRCRIRQPHPRHPYPRWRIEFYQPDAADLAAIGSHPSWYVCFVELALDWIIHDAAARTEAAAFFHRHHVHLRSGDVRIKGHSRYTRGRKSRVNVAMYADRPSKVTGEPCVHIECRIRGRAALLDHDIDSAADLRNYDHRSLWQELLTFFDLDVRTFGRRVMNRQTNDGRVRTTVLRRRTPLIRRYGQLTIDIDRRAGWRHLRISGSMQQLIADLRHTVFSVQRQHLIRIPTPEALLPQAITLSGYRRTTESVPITHCHHAKLPD